MRSVQVVDTTREPETVESYCDKVNRTLFHLLFLSRL